ncbi:HNH endonuclease [bacterium]|nr:HNH endonuclease [bacterium]
MASPSRDKMHVYEYFAKRVTYHPLTGLVYWKEKPKAGGAKWHCLRPVGSKKPDGYMQIGGTLNSKSVNVLQHNLAWFMIHGELPKNGFSIDHKNDRPGDNRLENLRILSHTGQLIARARGSDLPPWVDLRKDSGKFRSQITVNGKLKHLGHFEDAWQAHVAAADYAISNGLIDPAEYAMLISEWHEFRGGAKNG